MKYDRQITISAANSRKSLSWVPQTLKLSELFERLKTPARGTESLAEYTSLPKAQQDTLKDVGGFVAGRLLGGRRRAGTVLTRELITLDYDNIPPAGTDDILRRVGSLSCGYCVYSTRKHSAGAPRLRILLPLDRPASAEEYEPCARMAARLIGIEFADPTTFEASRLMYWPSCCADSQYIYRMHEGAFLSVNGLLAQYRDWKDASEWPRVPGVPDYTKRAAKQADPEGKTGVVGAFCRIYDVYKVMDELLPGVYEPVANSDSRFTFTGGSTTGGAVVYENGKFLFSHHATDPCSGQLVNAFDLVRLHKFGELDNDAAPGTPTAKLPSYLEMSSFALSLPTVKGLLLKERQAETSADFEGLEQQFPAEEKNPNWREKLSVGRAGTPSPTIDNLVIILKNDPLLVGRMRLNEFSARAEACGEAPWSKKPEIRTWEDADSDGLKWYIEKVYGISSPSKVESAFNMICRENGYHPVRNYLNSLQWDGLPRLDTVFIDYLGAEDTAYTRAVTRKSLTAAVARVMVPGIKFDSMTIFYGIQGLGKSSLLRKLSRGWFCDSIRTFEGKDAAELVQGAWLIEISELEAFQKSDVSRIKQFLSAQEDRFRAAYGRYVQDIPRQCVFFGTTNQSEYLQDFTGGRRFWPVDAGKAEKKKSIWADLNDAEIGQIWAEAVQRWNAGESLFLSPELEAEAEKHREEHREVSPREGIICAFLEKKIPADWLNWELDKRLLYWSGAITGMPETDLVERDRVCALEVWCEAFQGKAQAMRRSDAVEINNVISTVEGWKQSSRVRNGCYGRVRGWVKAR